MSCNTSSDTGGSALPVTRAEVSAGGLPTPCCGTSRGCFGLDASQTKGCANEINVLVLLSSERAEGAVAHGAPKPRVYKVTH